MKILLKMVEYELSEIEKKGLCYKNLDMAAKLVQMYHHLAEEDRAGHLTDEDMEKWAVKDK